MTRIINFTALKVGDRLTIDTEMDTVVKVRIDEVIFVNPHLKVTILAISVKKGHNLTVGATADLYLCNPRRIALDKIVEHLKTNQSLTDLRKGYYGLLSQEDTRKSAGFKIASLSRR